MKADSRKTKKELLEELGKLREENSALKEQLSNGNTEEEIEHWKKRYKIISEIGFDYAYAIEVHDDNSSTIQWVTEAYQRITGYTLEELVGKGGFKQLLLPDEIPFHVQRYERLLANQPDISEFRIRSKEGKIRWLRDYSRPIFNNKLKRVVEIHGVAQEITERKQAELEKLELGVQIESETKKRTEHLEKLNKRLQRQLTDKEYYKEQHTESAKEKNALPSGYEQVFEKNGMGMVILDSKRVITHINRKLCDMLEYTQSELIGENISLIHESEEAYSSLGSKAYPQLTIRDEVELDLRLKKKSGKLRWFRAIGYKLTDVSPQQNILWSFFDITDWKIIQQKFLLSENRFRLITETSSDIIFQFDTDGKLIYCSPAISRSLQYKPESLLGKHYKHLFNYKDVHLLRKSIKRLIRGEKVVLFEAPVLKQDGDENHFEITITPILDEGEIIGFQGVAHDINKRREEERTLENLNAELRQLNADKDKFFSIIAHDLRAPFTPLLGFSSFLANEFDSLSQAEIEKIATSIHKTTKNIFNLLEDLLQWSRLQLGKVSFVKDNYKVHDLVEDTISVYKSNAEQKNITLKNEVSEELTITIDKYMFDTSLRNLISNAIKFTHSGGEIRITAEKQNHALRLSVIDNGIGMSSETQEKIFRLDIQHSSDGTEGEKGTGLGLVLCKEFLEKNGGFIEVESEIGKGSTFHLFLPTN